MRCAIFLAALVALIAVTSAVPQERPQLTAEASHQRFPGGHRESVKVSQDAWVSRDGNWKAGGYVQHDRERYGGSKRHDTHGGISITGTF